MANGVVRSSTTSKNGKTELYLKNEGALEDYRLDSVCRETVLHRGEEASLEGAELEALVKHIGGSRAGR